MKAWKITGFLAAVAIVLAIPIYLLKVHIFGLFHTQNPLREATFVGGQKCVDCHRKEYDKWLGSHHDDAMGFANEKTMKGDFNNAILKHDGVTSRFFRQGEKFFVNTPGPDGKLADFEITHTFGITPLQQYLVPFEGGRLQCLPIAWDTEKKKWFHLFTEVYPDEKILPDDWLYWTNPGQNWNTMCAECHSTHLRKGYDPETDTFNTTWSEIDVNCEACHGPGSRHVEWAELPEMARPQANNYELVTQTSNLTSKEYVEICARCHSRRSQLGDFNHPSKDLLDIAIPVLLSEELYFADGQILGEVYVYGSFIQSKMYRNEVSCRDCHDAHSLQLLEEQEPNDMCLTCHQQDVYDRYSHHFHKKKGEKGEPLRLSGNEIVEVGKGSECIECHMPARDYMGNDLRNDHSFRIPRPDLSLKLRTPNACTRCHRDKSDEWANQEFTRWYGIGRKPHYGTLLDAGRRRKPEAIPDLIKLAGDELYPVNVRATALSLLSMYPGYANIELLKKALTDGESLIRHTAVHFYGWIDPLERLNIIAPLLYDPCKAVRAQAAMNLSTIPAKQFKNPVRAAFECALGEYKEFMLYASDFASGRFNLGNLYTNLGLHELAVQHYQAAIKIDNRSIQAKNNLAILYNQMGKNDEALTLLREVKKVQPDSAEVDYSLGLLLAEMKRYDKAVPYLEVAARGLPQRARIHYNLGLIYQVLNRFSQAESSLMRALGQQPDNADFLFAMADHYVKTGEYPRAKQFADKLLLIHPKHPMAKRLSDFIDMRIGSNR
jgi:tetratricopeptide (TPR) repeat protein